MPIPTVNICAMLFDDGNDILDIKMNFIFFKYKYIFNICNNIIIEPKEYSFILLTLWHCLVSPMLSMIENRLSGVLDLTSE